MKRELRLLLISLLGFPTACDSEKNNDYPCMYGTPPVIDFTVSGTVTDAAGTPIPGIEVTPENGKSTLTDADGRYDVTGLGDAQSGIIFFKDIDGEENGGLFKEHRLDVEFTEEDRTHEGNGAGDRGGFAREGVDVVLDKETAEEE